MGGTSDGLLAGSGAKFLLSVSKENPVQESGRRAKAREKAEKRRQQNVALSAEKKPRTQTQWEEDQRKNTKLATVGDFAEDLGPHELDVGPPGKKKVRKLAVQQAKVARKAQKKVAADARASKESLEALKGKVHEKRAELSQAARDVLAACPRHGLGEQRLMAAVAERISGAPEREMEMFDVFFELHQVGVNARSRKLAILSAVAVFRDLVPGYRIRALTEQEKAASRSRETLALERYELTLLHTYRRLLPVFEAAMKHDPVGVAPALAALVKAACDFNFRERLIALAVRHANSPDAEVRRIVAEGLQEMLEADRRLEASKQVVLAIGRVAQAAASGWARLQIELVQVLLRLQVGRAEVAVMFADGNVAGAEEDVRRGIQEASITGGAAQLQKAEAELLYEVFVVYLRVLRQRHVHSRELIAAALVGLARWGQQVNLELLLEIIAELKLAVHDAINQADELVALQGLNCALVLLSGPSQALRTDVTWLSDTLVKALGLALPSLFSSHSESAAWPPRRCYTRAEGGSLYASKKELALALEAESVPCLLLRCLNAAMKCPHGFGKASDATLAALLENLFLLAASADAYVGVTLVREAAALLKRQRRLHTLLDEEGGLFSLGSVVDRAVSVVWPLHLLSCSVAPALARIGQGLPAAVKSRVALLTDLFPTKDAVAWLRSEFPSHLEALLEVPQPAGLEGGPSKGNAGGWGRPTAPKVRPAPFWSEGQLAQLPGGGLELEGGP